MNDLTTARTSGPRLATAVRMLAADMIDAANSGHPGLPLGMADVATVLFTRHLVFDPADPRWPDRDRFVLSGGHGSALLYALGWLCGTAGVELDHLRRFRQLHSPCAGHPEYGEFPIAETTTGPLGQGIATAVGMAIAEERLRSDFGPGLCDHHTWVVAGDGCLMEGITAEAIALAGHLRLDRLTVLWDDNRITIDGATDIATSEDQLARFGAAGWAVLEVDGHDHEAIDQVLGRARRNGLPTLVACHTTIGKGAPSMEGTSKVHGSPLGAAERTAMAESLGWTHGPFDVPADVLDEWRRLAGRRADRRFAWNVTAATDNGEAYLRRLAEPTPVGIDALDDLTERILAEEPTVATRAVNARALDAALGFDHGPTVLGGSADLTGSNGLKLERHRPFTATDRSGNFVNYGIREHAMAAAMNGIALHGGFRPFGGTFLAFADYSRPSIRLAALMQLPVVHVFTHDSIGVGEDGPTHQPVEHVDALRAIPGLRVIRPADAVETVQAWRRALTEQGPTALILSRQSLPALPRDTALPRDDASVAGDGAWVVSEATSPAHVTLLGTGSEVSIALAAALLLEADGIATRVVSVPHLEGLSERSPSEREALLGPAPRVVVEAGIGMAWQRWLRPGDAFVGMTGFGASAPGPVLYEHFGITPAAVADAARAALTTDLTDQAPSTDQTLSSDTALSSDQELSTDQELSLQ